MIRWIAIAGQAVALLVVHYAFDFRLPLLPAFAVVGCRYVLNLFITLYRRAATGSASTKPPVLRLRPLQLGLPPLPDRRIAPTRSRP